MARRIHNTKKHIIQTAIRMFLEHGYTNTSVKAISQQLDISTGNLTFHFPTKEHMLAVLVRMLCDFQWDMMRQVTRDEDAAIHDVCMELIAMASICDENDIVKDFYLSAYKHSMTLNIIRQSDTGRSKIVYGTYCRNWTHEHFVEAENLVSGIEYATLMKTGDEVSFETRIAGALNTIMMIYQIPEEVRTVVIRNTLCTDYRALGKRIFSGFMKYIDGFDDHSLEQFIIA